jgi:hypothetical protein
VWIAKVDPTGNLAVWTLNAFRYEGAGFPEGELARQPDCPSDDVLTTL